MSGSLEKLNNPFDSFIYLSRCHLAQFHGLFG